MTGFTIPMIIGMVLAFVLGAGFGFLFGLSRHEWLYCRITAHLTQRMREAMNSLGIEEWKIDKAQEYMGSVIIPPYIPMPEPPVKAASEREQSEARFQNAEPMEQREPCELAQTWPSRDRGGRSQREQARPQVKPRRDFDKNPYTVDEVVYRLTPEDAKGNGEIYCTARQPYKAWSLDEVKSDGTIVRGVFHDLRNNTIEFIEKPYYTSVYDLANDIIRYDFRFFGDFDLREWGK